MEADVHFREAEGGAPTEPGHTAIDGVRPRRISLARRALAVALPAAVCVAGIGFAAMMVATAPEAERTAQEEQGVPVEASSEAA